MSTNNGPRVGRHPGKMPNGIKLAACVEELTRIFEQMPIGDRDRATAAFAGMSAISVDMDFHDANDREPYVARWYLQDAAKKTMIGALSAGRLPTWTDYDGEFVELDPEAMFAPNKWVDTHTVLTGTYVALNVAYGRDGPTRAECDGATLWVHNDHWPPIRGALIAERERASAAALPADMMHLLGKASSAMFSPPASIEYTTAAGNPMWTLYEAVAWLASRDATLVDNQHPRNFPGTTIKNYGAVAWTRLAQSLSERIGNGTAMMTADDARKRLIAACESGRIYATGIPADRSDRCMVPAETFTGAEIWEGRGGSLHREVAGEYEAARWLDLRFAEPDVRKVDGSSPLDTSTNNGMPANSKTGAPGRPTSRHLILAEARRRAQMGVTHPTVAGEARALADWLASRPDAEELAPMTPRTIENAIREMHRGLVPPRN